MGNYATPNDFAEELWTITQQRREAGHQGYESPESKEEVREFVNVAFQASLHAEEGRPVRFRLLFQTDRTRCHLPLSENHPFTVGDLVRIAPTVDLWERWVLVSPGGSGLQIVGFLDPQRQEGICGSFRWAFPGLKLVAYAPGHLRSPHPYWIELRNGQVGAPRWLLEVTPATAWCKEAAQHLGFAEQDDGRLADTPSSLILRHWATIHRQSAEMRHGACFLVIPETGIQTVEECLKAKYRLDSDIWQTAIRERWEVEPELSRYQMLRDAPRDEHRDQVDWYRAWRAERNMEQVSQFIASLSAVDGAVVFDTSLRIHGFGYEICASGDPKMEVIEFDSTRGTKPVGEQKALTAVGMRHRSAAYFCSKVKGAVAIVISQDGDTSVMFQNDQNCVERHKIGWIEPWMYSSE